MYRPSPRGPGLGSQGQPNAPGMPGGQFNPPPSAGNPPGSMPPQPQMQGRTMGGFQPSGHPRTNVPTPSSPSMRPMGFGGGPPRGPPVGGMQNMSLGPGQQASPKAGHMPPGQGFSSTQNIRPSGFPGPQGVPPRGFPGTGSMPGGQSPSSTSFPGNPGAPPQGPPGGGGFGGFPGARPSMPPTSGAPFAGVGQFPRPGQAPGMGQYPGPQRPVGPPSGPVGQQPGIPGRPMMMGPPSAPGPAQFSQPMGGPQQPRPPGPPGAPGFYPPPGPPGPGTMAPHMTAPRPSFGQGMERPQSPSSRIDPNQIPRPELNAKSDALPFLTRDKNQHQAPPQACSKFITKDMGNCSPHHIRLSLNNVPTSNELVTQVTVPLVLFTQPLALPNVGEEPIQVVDFGEDGPVRCNRCRAYINPFFQFQDGGRTFVCPLCGAKNETPANYFCYLGPDGRRRDVDERPELCRGTVEFAAPSSFSVRPPMPPCHFFLVDVSYQAVTSGAMHVACNTIKRVLDSIQGGSRAMAGIATFDGAMHFYGLKSPEASPQMLVVSDISEAFAPVPSTLLVPVQEYKDGLLAILDLIPQMFSSQKVADSCAGVAIEAAVEVLKTTGGKLHCILSGRPSKGLRALQQRDTVASGVEKAEKEKQTVLIPQDNTYRTLAIRAADFQVCVDLFLLSQAYVDVATLSTLCQTTGGSVYRYAPFQPQYDEDQFVNDLRWNLTRPQGMEAVLRVRCSEGLEVENYLGSCYLRTQTDVDLPAIDCDKSIMVKIKHDDKLQEGAEAVFQSALLYTSTSGQRRIRVNTMAVNITSNVSQVFRGADLECYLNYLARKSSISIAGNTLGAAKEAVTNACVGVLHAYRKYCATPMTSTGQLILPDALKLLPLYALAFLKSAAIRADVRPDERATFLYFLYCLPCSKILPLLYGRFVDLSTLIDQKDLSRPIPPSLPLSSENLKEGRLFLLENGNDLLLKVESNVPQEYLKELFGIDRVNVREEEPRLLLSDGPFNKAVHAVINEMRKERSSYMKLRVALRSQPFEQKFLNLLVEDRSAAGMSYVEYLCHVHRCIQGKMN